MFNGQVCLVERPADRHATRAEASEKVVVYLLADINVVLCASHALVLDSGRGRLAIGVDGDGLAAEDVSV